MNKFLSIIIHITVSVNLITTFNVDMLEESLTFLFLKLKNATYISNKYGITNI